MKISQFIMTMVAFLIAASARAGDLTVDNLNVSSNATIMGNLYFSSTADGTNGGAMATGGTITTNGNYIIHTFTNIGTTNFVVSSGSLTCDVLIVAGGGAGGNYAGGGGGAGGYIATNLSVSGNNTVTVGDGGVGTRGLGTWNGWAAVPRGSNGNDSAFGDIEAIGGGGGGTCVSGGPGVGGDGGSGGGGQYTPCTGGTGSQGHDGGTGYVVGGDVDGGGGGGAGSAGANAASHTGGNGGTGLASSMSGENKYYAAGGGGSVNGAGWTVGQGGSDIGGDGSSDGNGGAGTANTGSGGGGAFGDSPGGHYGGNGGSGIVIVRYATTTSSNITTLSISSNGISQVSTSGVNVLMGKVGIGTNNPAEKLHVVGNARVDGTNIVAAITLGGETRATWPTGNLSASNNLADIADQAAARTNLGLGTSATNDASAFDSAGAADAVNNTLSAHTANLNNPHQVTASQAGALTPTGNGSQLTDITAAQVGALSTNGGVVNGDISLVAPAGDIPMGIYTNQ